MTRRREDGILKAPSALPARERSGTVVDLMIVPWNCSELATVITLDQCSDLTRALEEAGIDCHVKVVDRTLHSGSRERSETLFQEHSCQYTIYVLRRELQAALETTGLTPIR